MKPAKGYYCLIQYCPDLSRLEAANIGVLLFCPEHHFLKARTARDNRRIRQFFGSEGHDWSQISSFKRGIEERVEVESQTIQTVSDLEKFISLRANRLQITPIRPMQVIDPDKGLDKLFRELVGGEPRKDRQPNLRKLLSKTFHDAGLEPKLQKDIEVEVPILERKIEVPYGYQNGRFNLIQPARFEAAEPIQVINTACRYAVEGRSLHEHDDPKFGQLQLIVVGRFRQQSDETKSRVNRVLTEHDVRLFTVNDLPQLIEEIRETAKDITPAHGDE